MGTAVIFFGHHKCASRFFRLSVLGPMAKANGYESIGYKIADALKPFHFDRLDALDLAGLDFATLSQKDNVFVRLANATAEVKAQVDENFSDYRGVRAIRDPRQIIASGYFHHREGHNVKSEAGWVWDRLQAHRSKLLSMKLDDGLIEEMDTLGRDVIDGQVLAWGDDARVLEVKVEDINLAPMKMIHDLKSHCGFTRLGQIQLTRQFSNEKSHDWRSVFSPRVVSAFKDRYGASLIKLGYESNMDW